MRMDRTVCARFQSVGKPEFLRQFDDIPVLALIKELIAWTQTMHMGTAVRITWAADSDGLLKALGENSRGESPEDIMAKLMADLGIDSSESEES